MSFLNTVIEFAEKSGYKITKSDQMIGLKRMCFIQVMQMLDEVHKTNTPGTMEMLGMNLTEGFTVGFHVGMGSNLEEDLQSMSDKPDKVTRIRSCVDTPDYRDGKKFAETLCEEWVKRGNKFYD